MKSILDQIAAAKADATDSFYEMLKTSKELNEFEKYNPYPIDKPFDERCVYYNNLLALNDKANTALATSKRKVIHLGELLGVNPVKFRLYDGETYVMETYYRLERYCEEMESQLKRVVETYNEYHH